MIFGIKKLSKLLIILGILFIFWPFKFTLAQNQADLYVFYGQGCPHCAKLSQSLGEWQKEFPQLKISSFEVFFNPDNRQLYFAFAKAYQLEVNDVPVPLVLIGEKSFIGYNESIKNQIHQEILRCLQQACPSPLKKLKIERTKGGLLNLAKQKQMGPLIVLLAICLVPLFVLRKIFVKIRHVSTHITR